MVFARPAKILAFIFLLIVGCGSDCEQENEPASEPEGSNLPSGQDEPVPEPDPTPAEQPPATDSASVCLCPVVIPRGGVYEPITIVWPAAVTCQCDDLGNVVSATREAEDGEVDREVTSTYDANGRWMTRFVRLPGLGFTAEVTRVLDEQGRMVSHSQRFLDNGEVRETVSEYTYDQAGRLLTVTSLTVPDDSLSDGRRVTTLTYDEGGRLVLSLVTVDEAPSVTREFAYDDDGNEVSFAINVFDHPERSTRSEMVYENGVMVLRSDYSADTLSGTWHGTYDEHGRLQQSERRNANDRVVSRHIHAYDGEGRLVERQTMGANSEVVFHTTTYTYNDDEQLHVQRDAYNNGTTLVSTYLYDEYGNRVATDFDGDADGTPDARCVHDPPCEDSFTDCLCVGF